MFRVAAALIVMTVAASPTAKVICDLACVAKPSGDGHHACHEALDEGGPAVTAAPKPCARIASVAPFTPEGVFRVSPAAAASVVFAVSDYVDDRNPGPPQAHTDTGPPAARIVAVLRI